MVPSALVPCGSPICMISATIVNPEYDEGDRIKLKTTLEIVLNRSLVDFTGYTLWVMDLFSLYNCIALPPREP